MQSAHTVYTPMSGRSRAHVRFARTWCTYATFKSNDRAFRCCIVFKQHRQTISGFPMIDVTTAHPVSTRSTLDPDSSTSKGVAAAVAAGVFFSANDYQFPVFNMQGFSSRKENHKEYHTINRIVIQTSVLLNFFKRTNTEFSICYQFIIHGQTHTGWRRAGS